MESIYGSHIPEMEEIRREMINRIDKIRAQMKEHCGMDPVEHCLSRIKAEESMREKCRRRGLEENEHSALDEIKDAIGVRIVCAFVDDVFMIKDHIKRFDDIEVINEKDYINNAKPNGYRSYHMIIKVLPEKWKGGLSRAYYIEIQLRTISMDTWAALEHHMKYKKEATGNEELIISELKRCADELASTDVSMQIIRNLIFGEL